MLEQSARRTWSAKRVVALVFCFTTSLITLEFIGGYIGHSKGLITAAWADAIDIPTILLILVANKIAVRPPESERVVRLSEG
jgi:Co/Zn/Cd efflux system component